MDTTEPQLHLVFLPASSSRSSNVELQSGQVTEMGMGMLPGGVATAVYSSKGIVSRGRAGNEAKTQERQIHARWTWTFTPSWASSSGAMSSRIWPRGLHGLAARGSLPQETGVGPKKMQKAFPGGQ